MNPLQRRFKALIVRFGEPFTVGAVTGRAVFSIITAGWGSSLLGQYIVDSVSRPLRIAYAAHDDATVALAILVWNGQSFTVQKVIDVRFRATTVARLLVLTPV